MRIITNCNCKIQIYNYEKQSHNCEMTWNFTVYCCTTTNQVLFRNEYAVSVKMHAVLSLGYCAYMSVDPCLMQGAVLFMPSVAFPCGFRSVNAGASDFYRCGMLSLLVHWQCACTVLCVIHVYALESTWSYIYMRVIQKGMFLCFGTTDTQFFWKSGLPAS